MDEDKIKDLLGSWYPLIGDLLRHKNMDKVTNVLKEQRKRGYKILPNPKIIFEVFKEIPINELNGVILFDEPYSSNIGTHRAIACKDEIDCSIVPRVLSNFIESWESSLDPGNFKLYHDQELEFVKDAGILLLNASLTVIEDSPKSHIHLWKWFTVNVLTRISEKKEINFLLLGEESIKYKKFISQGKILEHINLEEKSFTINN